MRSVAEGPESMTVSNLADGQRLIRIDIAELTGRHVIAMARPN